MTYALDQEWPLERERLAAMEDQWDPGTKAVIESLGIGPGWRRRAGTHAQQHAARAHEPAGASRSRRPMSSRAARSLNDMRTPTVIHINRQLEPVAHDTFIEDLRTAPGSERRADPRKEPHR